MISVNHKIHDSFTVEFKFGFNCYKQDQNLFSVNTWIFIPYSLDINSLTYHKSQFYKDLRSNIRFITPVYSLSKLKDSTNQPLTLLNSAIELAISSYSPKMVDNLEYNIKMFCAIYKSSLRNEAIKIKQSDKGNKKNLTEKLIKDCKEILLEFREIYNKIAISSQKDQLINYIHFGDEFISNVTQKQLFRITNHLSEESVLPNLYSDILALLTDEIEYRKTMGFEIAVEGCPKENRQLVFKSGSLKKYIESELFLKTTKRKDAIFMEQLYFSIAAGISMIFATTIAFTFQTKFGNLTIPLFIALVFSYMLKDRIKDLGRFYFAHRLKSKYFDNRTDIAINQIKIGWMKEAFDFIDQSKSPKKVTQIRDRTPILEANNRYAQETTILYRKLYQIDRALMDLNSEYRVSGINEILRFNLWSYMQKMDDPYVPLYVLDKTNQYKEINGSKIYYLNFIIQFKYNGTIFYKRFRVIFNRSGIKEIEEIL